MAVICVFLSTTKKHFPVHKASNVKALTVALSSAVDPNLILDKNLVDYYYLENDLCSHNAGVDIYVKNRLGREINTSIA